HGRRTRDLADGFLLHPQARQDRRRHRRRYFAAHDLAHQVDHLVVEDLAMLDRALQRFVRRDAHVHAALDSGALMKLRSRSWPWRVRIDSGWNCTPSTVSALWRSPMISSNEPSACSVHAVISRHSGRLARSTTNEW